MNQKPKFTISSSFEWLLLILYPFNSDPLAVNLDSIFYTKNAETFPTLTDIPKLIEKLRDEIKKGTLTRFEIMKTVFELKNEINKNTLALTQTEQKNLEKSFIISGAESPLTKVKIKKIKEKSAQLLFELDFLILPLENSRAAFNPAAIIFNDPNFSSLLVVAGLIGSVLIYYRPSSSEELNRFLEEGSRKQKFMKEINSSRLSSSLKNGNMNLFLTKRPSLFSNIDSLSLSGRDINPLLSKHPKFAFFFKHLCRLDEFFSYCETPSIFYKDIEIVRFAFARHFEKISVQKFFLKFQNQNEYCKKFLPFEESSRTNLTRNTSYIIEYYHPKLGKYSPQIKRLLENIEDVKVESPETWDFIEKPVLDLVTLAIVATAVFFTLQGVIKIAPPFCKAIKNKLPFLGETPKKLSEKLKPTSQEISQELPSNIIDNIPESINAPETIIFEDYSETFSQIIKTFPFKHTFIKFIVYRFYSIDPVVCGVIVLSGFIVLKIVYIFKEAEFEKSETVRLRMFSISHPKILVDFGPSKDLGFFKTRFTRIFIFIENNFSKK